MTKSPQLILELPSEKDIESVRETKLSAGIIKRTVRYTSGLVIVFHQNFGDCVFSVYLKSNAAPFWVSRNQVYVLEGIPADGEDDC